MGWGVGDILCLVKYVWFGDGNNMVNLWIEVVGVFGFDLVFVCLFGYVFDDDIVCWVCGMEWGRIIFYVCFVDVVVGWYVLLIDVFILMG